MNEILSISALFLGPVIGIASLAMLLAKFVSRRAGMRCGIVLGVLTFSVYLAIILADLASGAVFSIWPFAFCVMVGICSVACSLPLCCLVKPESDTSVDAHSFCGKCGYSVRGLTTFQCPECGSDLRKVGITPTVSSRWVYSSAALTTVAAVSTVIILAILLLLGRT